ncbi:phage virion morphogenesis protein [Ignatzschineria rhizosphaerae]|uniref:Phage virion morphogenesis protein n=1 Tax=Ignatzschineria rhizosphaerae TaxID=2923279 RepID=A0ABY3X1J8_9GAMM|nr:phage virion morphogenesis protein [Ignatzschineria rhizosphaerae]UNM96731.1 phage virion morphogenesis protein [Ignatzschineria rhizosphaerae]
MQTNVLDDQINTMLKRVNPAKRRQFGRGVALALRAYRSNEILANRDVDGKPMERRKKQKTLPRKKNKGGLMFTKMGRRSSMQIRANANFASISFPHKHRKIAQNHQEGRSVQVNQYTKVKYPVRTLMGATKREERIVLDHLYEFMAEVL